MAPRPNSGLEAHEEAILGDSPATDVLLHKNNTDGLRLEDLDKEEESYGKDSVIIGLVVALMMAITIVAVCALVYRRKRSRANTVNPERRADLKKKDGIELKDGGSQREKRLSSLTPPITTTSATTIPATTDASTSSSASATTEGSTSRRGSTLSIEPGRFFQYAFIAPNRGLNLWRGRARILARHAKRRLLKRELRIHSCAIPHRCRAQLKRIYVY